MIASEMFGYPYEECLEFYPEGTEIEVDGKKIITGKKTHVNKAGKERRAVGKTMVLAGNYGMSGGGAGSLMGKSAKEGTELLNKYFSMFDGLKSAIDASKEKLKKTGYVEDVVGRRRRLPDIYLPKYTVTLKDTDDKANFNPFLNCSNRQVKDESVQYWEAVVKNRILASQKYQSTEAAKNGKVWSNNDEMSNAQYETIAKAALTCKVFKYKDKDGKDVEPVYWPDKKPLKPVIIQAYNGRIAQAERQCFNAMIQGSAGTLTKKAMLDIFNDEQLRQWDAHLIITVHDEVLVECKEEYADLVEKRLPEIMINAAKELGIIEPKMKCDPYCVSRWYADSAAVAIRDEFKKLETGDEKKGIAPVSREEAFNTVYKNHTEVPQEAIKKAIETGCDLEF